MNVLWRGKRKEENKQNLVIGFRFVKTIALSILLFAFIQGKSQKEVGKKSEVESLESPTIAKKALVAENKRNKLDCLSTMQLL